MRTDQVPGDKTATHAEVHQEVQDDVAPPDSALRAPAVRPGRLAPRRLPSPAARWLAIFAVSLGLLLIRFLVPTPVGQSDNRDGPRLMCGRGLGLNPVVPHGDPRFFRFVYFQYAPSPACGRWRDRFRTRQAAAAVAVAAVLAVLAGTYGARDSRTAYGQRLHHIQVVDMVFQDIVNGHDNARADLQALGLPASWAKYGGTFYWDIRSVRTSPLYPRYEAKFSDGNIARFLLTHPGRLVSIGQHAAQQAQLFRVTALGDYPPDAGRPPGAIESRAAVVTWLVHRLPPRLGLLWLIPLWCVMAAVAILALRRRGRPWHRDGAMLVLCMTGCAVVAFVPPANFAGISTFRHMVGMNLATALAFMLSVALAASMAAQRRAAARWRAVAQRPTRVTA